MAANLFLAILIVLMLIRDGALLVQHRRPFRLAFVAFWGLLACAHFTGRSGFYPAVAAALLVALWLKRRELPGIVKMFEERADAKLQLSSRDPGLWDQEMDGNAKTSDPRR